MPSVKNQIQQIVYFIMSRQSSITGFVLPKAKPDTPKRKRDRKPQPPQGVTSPSQASPDNKKSNVNIKDKDTPRQSPPMTTENKEEVKAKHRGRRVEDSKVEKSILDSGTSNPDKQTEKKRRFTSGENPISNQRWTRDSNFPES